MNMKSEKLLPLGSVIYLKEGVIPLMIGIRQPIVQLEKQCYFDYAGFSQITGMNMDEIAYFNNEDISLVVAEGYTGEEEERVLQALKEWRDQNQDIPKGHVVKDEENINNVDSAKDENSDDVFFGF